MSLSSASSAPLFLLPLLLSLLLLLPLFPSSASSHPFFGFDPPAFPAAHRQFVGIRTFPSSKVIFGARHLRQKLAENRRVERTDQNRQHAAYDRLLCMFATHQSPETCGVF